MKEWLSDRHLSSWWLDGSKQIKKNYNWLEALIFNLEGEDYSQHHYNRIVTIGKVPKY